MFARNDHTTHLRVHKHTRLPGTTRETRTNRHSALFTLALTHANLSNTHDHRYASMKAFYRRRGETFSLFSTAAGSSLPSLPRHDEKHTTLTDKRCISRKQ